MLQFTPTYHYLLSTKFNLSSTLYSGAITNNRGFYTMENKDSVSYPTSIIVHVNERPVNVEKLGLITYSKMSACIKDLLISVFELLQAQADTMLELNLEPGQKNLSVANLVASLIEKNVIQVIQLLHLCIPELEIEYLENKVGLDDTLVLVDAILKVNNINKVVSESKKMIADFMGSGN